MRFLLINCIYSFLYTCQILNLSREYLKEWNNAKKEAAELQRKCEDFLSRLASKLSADLTGNDNPMETVVSLVS